MNGSFINQIELNNYIEKLKCLKDIQNDNINGLKRNLSKVIQYYCTTNSSELISKKEKSIADLETLNLNLNKYISVIEHIIIKYQLLAKETNKKFNNIIETGSNNE